MIILKVILITLLILLGLVLALLAMILLIPIRYRVNIKITEEKEIELDGLVTYCLSAIKFTFSYYQNEFNNALYILGFRKKNKGALEEEFTEEVEETAEEVADELVDSDIEETVDTSETTSTRQTEAIKTIDDKGTSEKEVASKKALFSKEDILYWKKMITDEHNQSVVKKILRELGYLLKHFKFRKIETDLIYGTGDPALTGQILGALSMVPILYQYEIKIVPDFETEEPYVQGSASVAGKVRLIHLLVTGIRLLFDKEVRIVIKRFMRKVE